MKTARRERRLRTRLAVARRDTARESERSRAVVGRLSSAVTRFLICRSICSRRCHLSLFDGTFSSSPRMAIAGAGGSVDRLIWRLLRWRRWRGRRWRWLKPLATLRTIRARLDGCTWSRWSLLVVAAMAANSSSLPQRRLDMAWRVSRSKLPVCRRRSVAWRTRIASRTSVASQTRRVSSLLPPSRTSPMKERRCRRTDEQCR